MTSLRRTATNVGFNLLGQAFPALVAIWVIPILVRSLGTERFGALSIIWVLVGYSSFLDLGIPRALTGIVAARVGGNRSDEVAPLIATGLLLLAAAGVAGGAALYFSRGWLVEGLLKVPPHLQAEVTHALVFTAVAIPFVVTTGGIRGALEGLHRFDITNALRTPLSVFMLAGPLIAIPFSRTLSAAAAVLVAGRAVGWIAHVLVCRRVILQHSDFTPRTTLVGPLLRFGGWMTLGNIAGTMMSQVDRFLIGAFYSLSAIAYYTTPFDMVTRALVIPSALMAVGFPALSELYVRDRARASVWFKRATLLLSVVMVPLGLFGFVYAHELLTLWLGNEFAIQSTAILRVLIVGVVMNSVAAVPFGLIQGAGRADWTGKLQLVELPLYLLSLWGFLTYFGLLGAAIAWSLRVGLDAVANFAFVKALVPGNRRWVRPILLAQVAWAPLLFAIASTETVRMRTILLVLVLPCLAGLVGRFLLDNNDRDAVRVWLSSHRIARAPTGSGPDLR